MRILRAAILAMTILVFPGLQFVTAQENAASGAPRTTKPVPTPELERLVSDLLPMLSPAELSTLLTAGELSSTSETTVAGRIAPAFGREILKAVNRLNPSVQVEVLLLVPAPDKNNTIGPETYTILQSMSTMKEIEYYSASRGRMRVLFHDSYVVDDPTNRRRVPDPITTIVPRTERLYAYQHDSSFGRNVLEITYTTNQDSVKVTMQNLTRMLYQGIIPAVGPELLQLHLVIRPVGDHILFYGVCAARPVSLLGMEDRIRTSFYNRIVALHFWYMNQLQLTR
ncbi:MAG: hypothetical protein E4H09_04580 [Spirochaetales bacterium]|nr:MAG: hypothetical protein E4H09_04580 [Spirochaetales bacterium]